MFFTNPNQDLGSRFKTWWKELPLYSTLIFFITILTSIYSLIEPVYIILMFCFNPVMVVKGFYVWQAFTYPFISLHPISALFSLCAYMSIGSKRERFLGTFRFIIYFTLQNIVSAIIFSPFFYFLVFMEVPIEYYIIKMFLYGLWPTIMAEMVIRYNEDGEELTQFMCFPINIKRKWYPWAFFLLFSLIFGVLFDLITGIFTGYICKNHLDLYGLMKWSDISDGTAHRWEERLCCCKAFGYVSVDESGSELPSAGRANTMINRREELQVIGRSSDSVTPFTGVGYRLGD